MKRYSIFNNSGLCKVFVRTVSGYIYKYTCKVEGGVMSSIIRTNVNEEYAYSEIVEAGDFAFLSFCVGNVGEPIEEQVHGALNDMENRLAKIDLTLHNVVKMDVLLRDPWNIPIMEKVFKERFEGVYPARKTIQTEFAHIGGPDGLHIQIDAIAYKK